MVWKSSQLRSLEALLRRVVEVVCTDWLTAKHGLHDVVVVNLWVSAHDGVVSRDTSLTDAVAPLVAQARRRWRSLYNRDALGDLWPLEGVLSSRSR